MLKSETIVHQQLSSKIKTPLDHRILVVDDEELFREIVVRAYPLLTTNRLRSNYNDALEMFHKHQYSLVILDFMLIQ